MILPKLEVIMTLEFKSAYIRAIRERYHRSSKKEKSAILDELCKVAGYHRKYAIEILSKGHKSGKKLSGRTRQYSEQSIKHLKRLWHIMGRICSKKMKAAFPIWLNYYEHEQFNDEIKTELMCMSAATIDRYLKSYKAQFARRKRTGTKSNKRFSNIIPIKDLESSVKTPGHFQADTVAHCGNSLSGTFIWTLTVTCEHSGWTMNRAIFGKYGDEVTSAMYGILRDTPFKVHSMNTDSGTEFINDKLKSMLESKQIEFTRSRPYRKNDNCYVEQKNFTHVREVFGYERYDQIELVYEMNHIYRNYFNDLYNFFIPQLKCVEVKRVGAKYVRKYDSPKSPYQRLLESDHLSNFEKQELRNKFNTINPIKLRKELNDQIKRFNRLNNGKSNFRYKYSA